MIDPRTLANHPNFGGFVPKFGTAISDFGGLVRESGRAAGKSQASFSATELGVSLCRVLSGPLR